jgi:hypothetical protein
VGLAVAVNEALIGRQLSLVFVGETDDKEDWPVITGVIRQGPDGFLLERPEGWVPLLTEWLDRIKPVEPRLRDILLGAEYVLPLRLEDLPANATPQQLHHLGLKRPRDGGS